MRTKDRGGGGGGQRNTQRGKGGKREEFGRWEAIHRGYKGPMSIWVEGQKTELALERVAQFIHVRRLGKRGGQAYKCTGDDNTQTHTHAQTPSFSVFTVFPKTLNGADCVSFRCLSTRAIHGCQLLHYLQLFYHVRFHHQRSSTCWKISNLFQST